MTRKKNKNLIISDLLMPVMDGYEFVRRLREEPDIGKTPVIFSTTHYVSRDSQDLAEKCGVALTIFKPCEPQVVLDSVEAVLSGDLETKPTVAEPKEFCAEHLQLLTSKLSQKANELRDARGELISERAKGERELSESRALLAGIIDSAMDAIITIDSNQRVLMFNGAAEKMFRCTAAEVIGQSLERFIPARFRHQHSEHIREFGGTGITTRTIEATHDVSALRANGEEFPVEASISQIEVAGQKLYTVIMRDISERKLAQDALRASEAEMRALFASMTDVIIEFDDQARHLKIAPTKSTHFYKPAAERIGKTVREVFTKDKADFFLAHVRQALDQGHTHRVEYSLAINEKELWYDASISPMTDNSVIWVARDITARKQADELLRQSEILNRSLVEHLPHRIFVKDRNSGYLFCNSNYALDLGIGPQEIVGKDDFAFFSPALAEAYRADDREVMAAGKTKDIEERYELAGAERWIHTIKVPYRNEQGEIIGVLGLFEDITERKRTEADLLRLAAAVEQTADSIVITDPEGNIQYVNPAFERITGYAREDVLGQNPRILKSGQTDPAVYKELWETITRGEVWVGQLTNRKKDGTLFEERVTISPVHDKNDHIVNYIAVKQDISDLTKLEDQLRQSQKMEAIGQLAGGVAHDFNNLLTAIIGYSDLAQRRIDDDHPLKGYLEEIKKAGDRAANLTRQLLAFGRKQMLQPVTLNLDNVVSDMNKMLCRLIGEDIKLTAKFDPALKQIKADPGQVEQVLVNLVVNARDAMPRGGNLTIETSNFEIDREYADTHIGAQPGKFVMLAVSDTGTGMDDETKARIFEPFFTTKEKGKGTGLGLSTVYGIVKQSGGYVWVYSELGHGTSFKIYLPQLETEITPVDSKSAEVPAPGGSETILLVEDDDNVRGLARKILEQAGYKVLDATNGNDAIRLWEEQSEPIHLLLTDVVMPETSGKEIADRLTSLLPTIRVLFMSGYTDEAIVHHGIVDSGVEFIQKPFSPTALAKKVREVLDLKS